MPGRILVAGLMAMVLVGCGSSSTKSSSTNRAQSSTGTPAVTLSLVDGQSNVNATACGKQEAFERYPSPARVAYTGDVSPAPSGRFKVKLKLKRCDGNQFVDADSQKIVGQSSGRFDGVFAITRPGAYSLRATLEGSGRPVSPKVYLQVGG